jgi:hypothetical protein
MTGAVDQAARCGEEMRPAIRDLAGEFLEPGTGGVGRISMRTTPDKALAAVVLMQAVIRGPGADPDALGSVSQTACPAGPAQQRGAEPQPGIIAGHDQAMHVNGRRGLLILVPVRVVPGVCRESRCRRASVPADPGQAVPDSPLNPPVSSFRSQAAASSMRPMTRALSASCARCTDNGQSGITRIYGTGLVQGIGASQRPPRRWGVAWQRRCCAGTAVVLNGSAAGCSSGRSAHSDTEQTVPRVALP